MFTHPALTGFNASAELEKFTQWNAAKNAQRKSQAAIDLSNKRFDKALASGATIEGERGVGTWRVVR